MALKFWYSIDEKPVGNWRPKISFGYSWAKKDSDHNPEFKPIYLVARGLHSTSNKETAIEAFISECKFNEEDPYMAFVNIPSDGEIWCLYALSTRGTLDTCRYSRSGTAVSGEPDLFSSIKVLDPEWINPLEGFSKDFEFYGPWKPGQTPDYGEIIATIKVIGTQIAKNLQNGLDSGSSYKIEDELVYKNGEFISKDESERDKALQGKIRKIDIDDEDLPVNRKADKED